MTDPTCARCGVDVSVHDECEWNDGDICWPCLSEFAPGLLSALNEIVAMDRHAGPFCGLCKSRPGLYDKAREIARKALEAVVHKEAEE